MGFKGRRLCVAYCCRGVVIESTRCAAVISAIPRTYLGVPQEINAFVYVPACMYVDGYRLQPFPRAPATSCPCTYVPLYEYARTARPSRLAPLLYPPQQRSSNWQYVATPRIAPHHRVCVRLYNTGKIFVRPKLFIAGFNTLFKHT